MVLSSPGEIVKKFFQSLPLRRVEHPGPCVEQALHTVPSRCITVHERLQRGYTILEAFSALLKKYDVDGAVARMQGGDLYPASYVLPALSTDPNYAVYYSQTHKAHRPLALTQGAVTIGLRDQQTWLHCHARWTDEHGMLQCGHLLPEQTCLANDIEVELTLLLDATFEVCADEHTHFSLFKPRPNLSESRSCDSFNSVNGFLVRIGPNVDFGQALLEACDRHEINAALVQGGVGSVVGAVFDDGRVVEPFVTELMVRSGHVDCLKRQVTLDISLIDYTGAVTEGRLALGQNPVLVTCELVLIPVCTI